MTESSLNAQDLKAGRALLEEGKVGTVLFSEGTYQVEVADAKESFWPFLQLDDAGEVLDRFCTCKRAEKQGSCPHLAAAYLQICKGEPLHVRFRASLWNQLCLMASHRHGYDTSVLKGDKEGKKAISVTGKRLFFVQPRGKAGTQKLKEILVGRAVETEETSLKFSNLPADELTLWREGRPSQALRYELSFWSDLAKWWMLLQEKGQKYEISFVQKGSELPKEIVVRFADVEFGFYVAEVNWATIIPALATVDSPLSVHEFAREGIQKITYLPQERVFEIDFAKVEAPAEAKPEGEAVRVGEWNYIPKKGFFPAHLDPLLKEKVIPESKIAAFLHKHAALLQKHLEGTKIHRGSVQARYHLFFNGEESLHISCYVLEPGDLQKETSVSFGPWVYVEDKGFYLLENILFRGVEKIVPKAKVGDFVNRHRHWLNVYDGFQTHVSSIESRLTYILTKKETLRFEVHVELMEEQPGEILDFDDWLYVKGRGFYAKVSGRGGSAIRPGLEIASADISHFIYAHREELEHIHHFFSAHCPLEKGGLNITLNEQGRIFVRPEYFFRAPYKPSQVHIFGDFAFVEGEGFSEIPPEQRLPDGYSREKEIDARSESYFVAYELDRLVPFTLSLDPRLQKPKELYLRIAGIKRDEKSKTGEWVIDLDYETDIGSIDAVELWRGLNEQKRYLFTSAGLIHLKQPRFNWLKAIPKRRWLKQGKQLRLTTLEWLRLTVFEDLREPSGESKSAVESRRLLEEFTSFHTHELIDLQGLKSDLRPYQETGVRWLWFLYVHGLSGLLCDEMGLGKTHQAMGLLAAVYNANKTGKYLVVCPTSVIYHWEGLLKRFLPHVKVAVFYGLQRSLNQEYDLLLTSYGTLRSERKGLSELSFEVAVFDEIQIAKNSHSQTHKALRLMKSKMRLGLTGTPIENHLSELKALFDVVLPSYMPTESVFREFFVNPIEKSQDPEKKSLLARFIKPFVLRRKKSEVLLELPEKIEEIAYCDLSPEQKKLYKQVFLAHKEALLKDLEGQDKSLPYLHIFSLLSNLKQICDHPCLINKQIEDYHHHASGKWDLFVELLQEARESNLKLVVFSQYLAMLDIIELYLKEKGIGFAGIRGSTRNRKQQLDQFKDDPNCAVFVASLQAAGVGIDLVSASVVIHYDRWWNPAKENQATDRVHRIGQNRNVQVFKMVTKHTIEEHIHRLIEKKMALMEGVIGFDDQDQIKGLDRQELLDLLELINQDVMST
jgi:superfamily II DNA or RNA helicase